MSRKTPAPDFLEHGLSSWLGIPVINKTAIRLHDWEQKEERKRLATVKRLYMRGTYTRKQARERGLRIR